MDSSDVTIIMIWFEEQVVFRIASYAGYGRWLKVSSGFGD